MNEKQDEEKHELPPGCPVECSRTDAKISIMGRFGQIEHNTFQ
jgi:hypothetical protein